MKKTLTLLLLPTLCWGALKTQEPSKEEPKFPKLSLQQINYVSDDKGIINPVLLLKIKPGELVSFRLTDGTEIIGPINHYEVLDNKILKLFGESTNQKNCGFGFVIGAEQIFAGALVFRDTNKVYNIKYNDVFQGYILEFAK